MDATETLSDDMDGMEIGKTRTGLPALRGNGVIVLIVLLAMAPPLASDIYLPGLPLVVEDLQTTQTLASNTLTVFFGFLALGSLLLGAISDKYGRKPVLLASIGLALGSCLLCSVAGNIVVLMVLRGLHGIGSGGMIALGTALAKDYFSGVKMARVIGFTQATAMLAPVVSPILGVAVLSFAGWRATFIAIAGCLTTSLLLACFLKEPLSREERGRASVNQVFVEMKTFFTQFGFMSLLSVGTCLAAPFMAYIGVASFVYEEYYGLSQAAFSAAFAATAIVSVIGPLVFARFTKDFRTETLVGFLLVVGIVCAAAMALVGTDGAIAFLVVMTVYSLMSTTVRPLVTNALLAPLKSGVGAASSLINFFLTAGGCVGMLLGSAGWEPVVAGMQVSMALFVALGALCFAIMVGVQRKRRQ